MNYESVALLSETDGCELINIDVEIDNEYNNDKQTSLSAELLPAFGLFEFNGLVQQKNVVLSWKTKSELYKPHFVIERSIDGINFKKVGFIMSCVNSLRYTFEFVDASILKQGAQLICYRLKQGHYFEEYMGSVSIGMNMKQNSVLFYLNNITNEIILNLSLKKSAIVAINILDKEGFLIKQNIRSLMAGYTSFPTCVKDLLPGKYSLEIKGGEINELKEFVIE
jgi:hypothetical protein